MNETDNTPIDMNETSTTADSKGIALKYGAFAAVALVAYGLLLSALDLTTNKFLPYINYIFLIVAIVMAHNTYKKEGDGYMSFGKGMGIAAILSLVAGFISSVFTYIYMKFIDLSIMDKIKDAQIEEFEKQGMSDAQIDQALEFSAMISTPEVLTVIGFIGMFIMSMIFAVIITAITNKKNPQPEF